MSEHKHEFPEWPFPCPVSTVAVCTDKVAQGRFPAHRVMHCTDGDWQFIDGTDDELGECVLLCLGCVLEGDASLAQVADLPPGWSAYRTEVGGEWEREENPPEDEEDEEECDMPAMEAKAHADIAAYGLHIISVREEGKLPPFSYSLGIEKSLGMPELIVVGLNASLGASVINACYGQMKSGTPIAPGTYVEDLLGGGFKCLIGEVSPTHYREYMGWAIWLHEGTGFRTWQIIFPSTAGVFPWEPEANEWFRNRQPLLAEPDPARESA